MSIESEVGIGTTVLITLPKEATVKDDEPAV
jgi:signal transduction histidine kinase